MTIAQFKLSDDPLLEHQQEDKSLGFSPTHFASDMQANSASPHAAPQQDAMVEEITSMDNGDITMEHQHTQISQTTIPSALYNVSQDLLTPWSCTGTKIFLDICSGADCPLSTAVRAMGLPALSIDILLDSRMDLLHDQFYEQLLRLSGSGVIGLCSCIAVLHRVQFTQTSARWAESHPDTRYDARHS